MSGSLLKFTSKIFPSFEDAGLKRHRLLLYSFSLSIVLTILLQERLHVKKTL